MCTRLLFCVASFQHAVAMTPLLLRTDEETRGILKVFLAVSRYSESPSSPAPHTVPRLKLLVLPQNVIRDAVTYAEHARRKVCVALLSPSPPPAKSINTAPARVLLSLYLPLSNVPTLAQTVTNLDVVYVSLSIYQTNAQPPPCHTILCLRPCHWRPSQSTCRLLAGTAAARKDVVRCAVGTCALVPQSCIHFPAHIAARLWRLKRDDLPDKGW